MKRLKVGIIGLGVGEAHIHGFQLSDCEVKLVADISHDRLASVLKKYPGIQTTNEASTVLEDSSIDLVSIASYDNFHTEQVMTALRNGKHVFVEKPLCLEENELVQIKKTVLEHPRQRFSSNLVLRMSPRFTQLRKWIAEGKLGRPYYMEGDYWYGRIEKILEGWRGKLSNYSAMLGGGVHLIDLLCWLSGKKVVEVTAYANRIATEDREIPYPDFSVALLRFEDGMLSKISSHFASVSPHYHHVTVFGTRGTFVNDLGDGKLFLSRNLEDPPILVKHAYPAAPKWSLIPNFVRSITKNELPLISAEDVFETMSICFAIERSIRSGRPEVP